MGSGGRGALVGGVPPGHAGLVLDELADLAGLDLGEGLGGEVVEVGDDVSQQGELHEADRLAGVHAGVDRDRLLDRLDDDLTLGVESDELDDELHQSLAHRGEHVGLGVDADILGFDRDLLELRGVEDHGGAVGGWGEGDLHQIRSFPVRFGTTFPKQISQY